MNPFFSKFKTIHQTIPFDVIKVEHFLPAIEEGIKQGLNDIDTIVKNAETPTFTNTIEALEKAGELIELVSSTFYNLNSAETNDDIQELAKVISPKLSDYSNDIILNDGLFKKVESVYALKNTLTLNAEQTTLLEKTYKSFVRNGSQLNTEQKNKLRELDKELSNLSLLYSENLLAESNAYELVITDKAQLSGLTRRLYRSSTTYCQRKRKR
jgi:Zn-dependent oligopeptidase